MITSEVLNPLFFKESEMNTPKGPVEIKSADSRKITAKERILDLIILRDSTNHNTDKTDIEKITGLPSGTIGSALIDLWKNGEITKKKKPGVRGYWYAPGPKCKVKMKQPTFSLELKTFKERRKALMEAKQAFDSALSQVNGALNILEARAEQMEKKEAHLTEELNAARNRASAAEAEHIKLLKKLEELSKF